MNSEEAISKSSHLIAIINEDFLKKEKNLEACNYAEAKNILKYAVVKKGIDWSRFENYTWRKIYFFTSRDEFKEIYRDITRDAKYYNALQSFKEGNNEK